MGRPGTVAAVGVRPPSASGNAPPIATLRRMKYPAWSVILAQVPASIWFCRTVWKSWSSTYQRSSLGVTARSHSKR